MNWNYGGLMLVELKDALCRTEPLRMSGLILCLHLHGIDTKHARGCIG